MSEKISNVNGYGFWNEGGITRHMDLIGVCNNVRCLVFCFLRRGFERVLLS